MPLRPQFVRGLAAATMTLCLVLTACRRDSEVGSAPQTPAPDNLRVAMTIAHTINETPMEYAVEVFPNMTEGPITIEVRKEKEPQVITAVDVLDAKGRVVMHHGMAPVRFRMDLSALPVGSYFVRVNTTSASRTVPVIVAR